MDDPARYKTRVDQVILSKSASVQQACRSGECSRVRGKDPSSNEANGLRPTRYLLAASEVIPVVSCDQWIIILATTGKLFSNQDWQARPGLQS